MVLDLQPEQKKTDLAYLFPRALLYRGAVPWEVVKELSCEAVWRGVAQLLEDEDWCYDKRDAVSAILYTAIAQLPEEEVARRRRLIQVKRDLYNLQARAGEEVLTTVLSLPFPATQLSLLKEYWRRVQRLQATRTQTREMLERAFEGGRAQLWEIIQQTPALLQGIALIAPELFTEVQKYVRTSSSPEQPKLTKEEISLMLYLTRAATKTSAFSTFTAIAQASIVYNDGVHCLLDVPDETQSSIAMVNHLPLVLFTSLLAKHAHIQRWLTLHVNPYCVEKDGRLHTVRVGAPDLNMRRMAYGKVETVTLPITLAITATLQQVTEKAERGAPHTLESLLNWLLGRFPSSPDARLHVEQLLQRLLEYQVLRFDIDGLQTETPIQDMSRKLAAVPAREEIVHTQLLPALHIMEEAQRTFAQQDPAERVETVRAVTDAFSRSFQALGEPFHERIFQPPLYESSMLKPDNLAVSWPSLPGLREDFQLVGQLMPLFRSASVLQALLTSFFTHLYGQGGTASDVLHFFQALRQQFTEDEFQIWSEAPWKQLEIPESLRRFAGEAQHLVQTRIEFLLGLNQQIEDLEQQVLKSGPDGALLTELVLDRSWLREIARQIPLSQQATWPYYAYMCQSVPRAEGDLFVINSITDGWGRHLGTHSSYLTGYDAQEDLMALLRRRLAEHTSAGHEFVELVTTHGFNGNMHPPLTGRVLVLPGEWTAYPRQQQIFLHDLLLKHDQRSNRLLLFHKREGTEIHLLYRGLLSTGLLGPLHRWLVSFTQAAYWSDLALTESFMGARGRKEQTGRIHTYPRLRLGQLVLARKKWMIPARLWPQWESRKCPDVPQLLAIERWRHQHGLPTQLYVRAALSRRSKPQFVDFHHALLLASLPKHLHSLDGWFKAEEALPAPDEYHQRPGGQHVVSTFWVEPY